MTTAATAAVAGTEADRLICWRWWRDGDTEDDSSESEALRREAISTVAVRGLSALILFGVGEKVCRWVSDFQGWLPSEKVSPVCHKMRPPGVSSAAAETNLPGSRVRNVEEAGVELNYTSRPLLFSRSLMATRTVFVYLNLLKTVSGYP